MKQRNAWCISRRKNRHCWDNFRLVEKSKIINGKNNIKLGDKVYGLKSSGPHTNGYSLIRKIYLDNPKLEIYPELLQPHRCYLNDVKKLWNKNIDIHGLCHITGGGFYDNIPRVLPDNYGVKLNLNIDNIYTQLGEIGNIDIKELLRVFNCGYGMLFFVDSNQIMPENYEFLGEVCEGEIEIN